MRRPMLSGLLALALPLAACAGDTLHLPLADGTHEVVYTFNPNWDHGANPGVRLPEEAAAVCPNGWRKLSERRQGSMAEGGSVTWHIACL